MRKLVLLVLLCAGLVGVGGGALAATASAANCTNFYSDNVVFNGNWVWVVHASGCTDVNEVQFELASSGNAGITDLTRGIWHPAITGGGSPRSIYYPAPFNGTYSSSYTNSVWGTGCGTPAFLAAKVFRVRIRNATYGTLGSWHSVANNQYLC